MTPIPRRILTAAIALALPLAFASGCSKRKGPPAGEGMMPQEMPICAGDVVKQDCQIYVDAFGTLNPPHSVDVKSQVTGEITEALFKEGDNIKKGDLLFKIDERPYQAMLDQAKADLAHATADQKMKEFLVDRNRKLVESGAMPQQTFAQFLTDQAMTAAKVEVDKANIQTNTINLLYCRIASPINGVAGRRQVDPGNIVQANVGATLVNIKTMDPLRVDFNLPERYLSEVRSAMKSGKLKTIVMTDQVGVSDDKSFEGELQFIENSVDNNTGTIFLRAEIPNKDLKLWAGQFVTVRLIFRIEKDAMLVPIQSVRVGKDGPYLFAIRDGRAKMLGVKTELEQGDMVMVRSDELKPGDKVVTAGVLMLADGFPVKIINGDGAPPAAPGAPPAAESAAAAPAADSEGKH